MIQSKVVPDNVDRMLLQVQDETLTAEPWRTTAPYVVINDVSGALSAWAREQKLQVRFVQDSAGLAADQASITGPVATAVSPDILDGVATVVYRLARPLEALEEVSWQIARWADKQVMFLAGQLQRHLNSSMNKVLEASFSHSSLCHQQDVSVLYVAVSTSFLTTTSFWDDFCGGQTGAGSPGAVRKFDALSCVVFWSGYFRGKVRLW